MRVSAFSVSNGFLTIMSKYSIAYFFKIVKWLAAFLPDLRGRGILPPIDENRSLSRKNLPFAGEKDSDSIFDFGDCALFEPGDLRL